MPYFLRNFERLTSGSHKAFLMRFFHYIQVKYGKKFYTNFKLQRFQHFAVMNFQSYANFDPFISGSRIRFR